MIRRSVLIVALAVFAFQLPAAAAPKRPQSQSNKTFNAQSGAAAKAAHCHKVRQRCGLSCPPATGNAACYYNCLAASGC
jgi:hypothetical protein